MDNNVIRSPEWLVQRMELLKDLPPPSLEDIAAQMEASDQFIRQEAERLATPTRDRARAVLLASALREAINTIEFLHGCLTSDGYQYRYPEHTFASLCKFKQLLEDVALIPVTSGCAHSGYQEDCEACRAALEHWRVHQQAKCVLNGSYGVEHRENAPADQAAVPAASGDHGQNQPLLQEALGHHCDPGVHGHPDQGCPGAAA